MLNLLGLKVYVADSVDICNYSNIVVHEFCHNYKVEWNIKIDNGVLVNIGCIIQAFNQIEIGKYLMLAPYVYISDNSHEYSNYNLAIRVQLFKKELNKVLIKDGVWIGTGVKIIGNVTIGFGSVVAANAVVVKDIPDHCVAAGVPAETIKICDYRTGEWINVKGKQGLFNEILSNRGIFEGYDERTSVEILEKKVPENDEINIPQENLKDNKLNLIATIEEGIIHVVNNIDIDNFQDTFKILTTIVDALNKIQSTNKKLKYKSINYVLDNVTNDLNIELSKMISCYEKNDIKTSKKIVKETIIPIIQRWTKEIIK